mmetsp:Transcript_68371/g.112405  ORF Transcript_68371/g.112405 Transcript_68371/m.112405 type:complete len:401 (-) Transcript_68371:1039-2241(-)
MHRFLLIAFLCVNWSHLAFSQQSGLPWTYIPNAVLGPANWAGVCSTGKRQSPIDITSTETTHDKGLGAFTLKNYDRKLNKTFTGSNNGHSFGMSFPGGVYNVSGGGLNGVYTTVQFHFHYGPNDTVGSEHIVDGEHYAAELHFVSYNTKYANLMQALEKEDGLAVLGIFIQVGGNNNSAFSFLETTRNLTSSYSSVSGVPAFRFDSVLPANKTKYFRYSGSLTTPSCKESVTWTVFRDAVNVSQYQMNLLRQLQKTYTTVSVGNYRPVQPLYNRTVRASFQVPGMSNNSMLRTTASTTDVKGTTTTTTHTTPKGTQSPISSTGIATKGAEKSSSASTTKNTPSNKVTGTDSASSIVITTTGAEESPPAPTVEFDLGSSAVRITAGLSMLLAALTALFVQH